MQQNVGPFKLIPETGGSLFTGSRQSAAGLNAPRWAKITGSAGSSPVRYSWTEQTPEGLGFVNMDGGFSGTVDLCPVIDPNGATLTTGAFLKVRRAYFDTTHDWVFYPDNSGAASTIPPQPSLAVITDTTVVFPFSIGGGPGCYKANLFNYTGVPLPPGQPSSTGAVYLYDATTDFGNFTKSGGVNNPVSVGDTYVAIFETTAPDGKQLYAGVCAYPRLAYSDDGFDCSLSLTPGSVIVGGNAVNVFFGTVFHNAVEYGGAFVSSAIYPLGTDSVQVQSVGFYTFGCDFSTMVDTVSTSLENPPFFLTMAIKVISPVQRTLVSKTFPIFSTSASFHGPQHCFMSGSAYILQANSQVQLSGYYTGPFGLASIPLRFDFGNPNPHFWISKLSNNQYLQKLTSP